MLWKARQSNQEVTWQVQTEEEKEKEFVTTILPLWTKKDKRFTVPGLSFALLKALTKKSEETYASWCQERPNVVSDIIKILDESGDNLYILFSNMTRFTGYKEMIIGLIGVEMSYLIKDIQTRVRLIMNVIVLRPKFFTVDEVDLVQLIELWLNRSIKGSRFNYYVYQYVSNYK